MRAATDGGGRPRWQAGGRGSGIRPYSGFTLLELLVALAVFSIMAVAAYSGLRSVLYTRAAVEIEAKRLGRVQMAWHFLEFDVAQTVVRPIRDEFGRERPALQGGSSRDEILELTRTGWDNPLGRRRSVLGRVAYRLEDGRLLRLHWDTLDRSGRSEPRTTMLLDAVRSVEVRFLDGDNEWRTEWPRQRSFEQVTADPPRAVEITLILDDWGGITRLFPLPGS